MHLEGSDVSLEQWADQPGRFQAASWHEFEGEQPLGKESPNDPLAGDREAVRRSVYQPQGQCGQAAALGSWRLHHQAEYGYSDEETALQIQENPYLQYFCGYSGYDDEKPPFDSSLMVYFRKRLTPEILGEINEMIVRDAKERQVKKSNPRMTMILTASRELAETAAP